MYDAFFKQLSAHDLNHHFFNGDESRRGNTLHDVHGRISAFSNKY